MQIFIAFYLAFFGITEKLSYVIMPSIPLVVRQSHVKLKVNTMKILFIR